MGIRNCRHSRFMSGVIVNWDSVCNLSGVHKRHLWKAYGETNFHFILRNAGLPSGTCRSNLQW